MSPALRSILFAGDFLHFSPGNLPLFGDYARADHAPQRAVRPRFRGLWPRKSPFSWTTERQISARQRGGALSSLPSGAFCFTRFAPWPSMTFAGRATDAALRHFRLSAARACPRRIKSQAARRSAEHKDARRPGKRLGRLPLSALRAHAASEPGQGSPRISFYISDK